MQHTGLTDKEVFRSMISWDTARAEEKSAYRWGDSRKAKRAVIAEDKKRTGKR